MCAYALVLVCRVYWSLTRPPHPIDVGSIAQIIGYDGTTLSGSDADFLAYAARYQSAGKPIASAPISSSSLSSTVFAKQTNTGGFILKMAVSDGKVIKIVNEKGDLWQPFSYISIPFGYELSEATFVIDMPDKVNTLLCKFTRPGTFEQPTVMVIFACSR